MNMRIAAGLIIALGACWIPGTAPAQTRVHDYLNDTALSVQATDDPVQKREILDKNLHAMDRALETVINSPMTSEEDDASLALMRTTLQEKTDELAGLNGFDRVPDAQLDAFATYVVQDLEQADQVITISVVTLLLIIIIIILVA